MNPNECNWKENIKAAVKRELIDPLLKEIAKRDAEIARLRKMVGGLTEDELTEARARAADKHG